MAVHGLVLAVCDQASSFNRPTIASDAWASTTPRSTERLFEYNGQMQREMNAERAVVWVTLLWGCVFRLKVELHAQVSQLPALNGTNSFVGPTAEAILNCPTGRIGWIDVDGSAPIQWHFIAEVLPGRYICRMTGDENPEHWTVEDAADYPPDGEDWTLHMAPAEA
jgi:hypothetical protein